MVDQLGADDNRLGTHLLRIDSVVPGSPLDNAGAVAGDSIRFDRYQDRLRIIEHQGAGKVVLRNKAIIDLHVALDDIPHYSTAHAHDDEGDPVGCRHRTT